VTVRRTLAALVGALVIAGSVMLAGPASADDPATSAATPTVSGVAQVGNSLSADAHGSDWVPAQTDFAYQWSIDGEATPGATHSIYQLTNYEIGHAITVTVTAGDGLSATSADFLTDDAHYKTPAPTITGTPEIGEPLVAHVGKWVPKPTYFYQYNWYVGGVRDGYQIGSTYYPDATTSVGKTITVSVSGGGDADHGRTATSPQSAATAAVADGTIHPGKLRIGSGVQANERLGASYSGPQGVGDFTWEWYIDGDPVASTQQFTPSADDYHHLVSVKTTLSIPGYAPTVTTSESESVGTGFFAGLPTIQGTGIVGTALTVDLSGISPAPTSVSVTWHHGGANPEDHPTVARGLSFTVTAKYLGSEIYAVVSYKHAHLYSTSNQTHFVKGVRAVFAETPAPTIAGDAVVGSKLSADHGLWSPSTGITYTYVWLAQSSPTDTAHVIAHATSSSLTLTKSRLGELISVHVTARKSGYATVLERSEPTSAVTPAP
jgi:hypothetical protein